MKKFLALVLVLMLAIVAFASCKPTTPPEPTPDETDEDLVAAFDYVKLTYKDLNVTPNSFEVMKNAPVGEKIFAVTWSTDNAAVTITESEDGNFYVVNIPELGETAFTYTLKFSVENEEGEKKEGSFNLSVPKFTVNTFAEYVAAEDGELLIVQGVVTGVMSKSAGTSTKENSLFLQDLSGKGGYYIYNLEEDPAGTISVGMTVQVSGKKKNYNGTFELTNSNVTIIDNEIKTVTPYDITELLAGADSVEAPELTGINGTLVTIKGVTLLEYSESNGYHYFEFGDLKPYLRISSSSNCITEAQGKDLTKMFEDNFYNAVDITGIVAVYNSAFYLMPVSAEPFTNIREQEKPADIKVDIALDNTKVPSFIQATGETTLPAGFSSFSDVVITWELISAEGDCATLNGNILNVAAIPESAKTVSLKATFAVGDISKTKDYTITVKGIDTISIKDIDDMVAGFVKNQYTDEKFYVIGTIQQISSDVYGNMYIVALVDGAEFGVDIYGLYNEAGKKYGDFEGYKPQVGDTIKVVTVVGKYNNAQLKNAVLLEYNHNYTETVTPPTCVSDGYTTYTCKCGHSYTDNIVPKGEHYYGEGVTDTTDMVCTGCGIKNHEHTTVAGDVVPPTCTTKGYTVYSCTDEACAFTENKDEVPTLDHNDTDGDFLCDAGDCDEIALPAADSTLTIKQAIALGNALGAGKYTTDKYYVTGTIKNVYNEKYGNMYITDADGTEYCIYGTYSSDGKTRYDALPTKPVAGETITVYGIIGSYGTELQMKNGWIQHNNTVVVTAPTCTEKGFTTTTCKYCGTSTVTDEVAALGHDFVDGECARPDCGALDHVHNYEYQVVVTPATCTTKGYTTHTCSCGESVKDTETEMIPHADTNGDYKCDGTYCTALVLPADGSTLTIAEAIKVGNTQASNSYTTEQYYVTGVITEVYNTTYGNMYITDGTNTLTVYGLYKDGTRYDKMTVKPVAGDTITVYGGLGNYNGTAQFKNAELSKHDVHTCTEFTEATCKAPAECVECGKTTGGLAEHKMVDGTCSVCGHIEGAAEEVLPGNLTFADAANKASADDYMKTNYPDWVISGKLGQTYGGYLGFGRSGDGTSSIKSTAISVTNEFTVTAVIKGNGSNGAMTSTLTFTLVDASGNVVATGYANGSATAAITPVDAQDTTYNISFVLEDGKAWTDVANLVISFSKTTGNIGLKTLEFIK